MWWTIGYIFGAVGMLLFVAWTALDHPLPRTKRSVINVVLAVVFWPVATVVLLVGFIYMVADAILFEARSASDSGGTCDQQNPPNAKWCRRCGKPLKDGRHAEQQ